MREIATLKVLGFTPREVNAYIFREIVLLAMLGALVGLGLGVVLEGFVVVTAEVDQVMFGRTIHWDSFVIAFVLTMVFTAVVMPRHAPQARPHRHGGEPEVQRVTAAPASALLELWASRRVRAVRCALCYYSGQTLRAA